jgi:guanylate kinase
MLLGNRDRGLAFVISAPAGTGKTTLVEMLVKEFPCVVESISVTTRPMRPGEREGEHYHFVDKASFDEKLAAGDFLEHVEVFDNHYGTSRSMVEAELARGNHIFLVIDTQGAQKLQAEGFEAVYIFVSPPSMEELQVRLLKRRTEPPDMIDKRLAWARKELHAAKNYDYQIVNDDLETAYGVLRSIVIAEEHRT